VKTGAPGYSGSVRPAALAAVALVAAALGAGGVLLVGAAAGWTDGTGTTRTVVVSTPVEAGGGPAAPEAKPLVGNTFDPVSIYARRSPGVVTIYSYFSGGRRSQGSGFVVSPQGHVLTNSHVITTAGEGAPARGAARVYVAFADGDRIPATIVGWDLFNDTGVLKVQPQDHRLTPVPLGDSSAVVVGEPVAAIGSPFDNQNSLSVGVVSAVSRSIPSLTSNFDVANAIQVDAPINHGNSGGPLLDARGRVIGINAQIRSDSGNAEGVGFAIPINSARRSMRQLIESGKVAYAYIGITTQDVTPALARRYGFKAERGALIERVLDGRPAARAGLRGSERREIFNGDPVSLGGDLIVSLAGERVERAGDIARIVTDRLLPGQVVPVTVYRGGKGARETVRVRLVARPDDPDG
jgi:2-alkenal reductase